MKAFREKTKEFFVKYDWVTIYVLSYLLSYGIAFLLICMGWYAYEMATLSHLNTNKNDTITAFQYAIVVSLPIFYLFVRHHNRKLLAKLEAEQRKALYKLYSDD